MSNGRVIKFEQIAFPEVRISLCLIPEKLISGALISEKGIRVTFFGTISQNQWETEFTL